MKFIVDAHLPFRLALWLRQKGFDVIHTIELPAKNKTEDLEIIAIANKEERIVITKDTDFFKYFLLKREPRKIILVTTGNISNKDLFLIFEQNLDLIIKEIEKNSVIEVNTYNITVHY